jgi:hypothetical protein
MGPSALDGPAPASMLADIDIRQQRNVDAFIDQTARFF